MAGGYLMQHNFPTYSIRMEGGCCTNVLWSKIISFLTFLVHHRFGEWLANKLTPLLRYLHDWYVLSSLRKRVEKSGWRPRSLCPWKDLLIHQKRTIKDFFGLSDHNALWEAFTSTMGTLNSLPKCALLSLSHHFWEPPSFWSQWMKNLKKSYFTSSRCNLGQMRYFGVIFKHGDLVWPKKLFFLFSLPEFETVDRKE